MTVAIAWVRTVGRCEELLFCTDSRLSGDGREFDACPKITLLPRSDCAMAFAGFSGHAYPMMQQIALALGSHAPLRRRSMDLPETHTHILKIANDMAGTIRPAKGLQGILSTAPEASLLFGGYSWVKKTFQIWTYDYSIPDGAFVSRKAKSIGYHTGAKRAELRMRENPNFRFLGQVAIIGDQAEVAEKLLLSRITHLTTKLDLEPFLVVRDMLRSTNKSHTIGGAPQVAKVYQYMESAVLGVFWPDRATGEVHLFGRKRLPYERVDNFVIDPDTLFSEAAPIPK